MKARNSRLFFGVFSVLGCSLCWFGCSKSLNFSSDAAVLEKSFSLTASSPQAGDPSTYKDADVSTLAKSLDVALRAGDMDSVAGVLHTLNFRGSGLSFDQYQAVRQVMADVGGQLAKQAAKGDEHAKELLKRMGP